MNAENRPDERNPEQVHASWVNRRREKIYQEIQANRRGEYTVPTWVLTVALVAVVVGFGVLIYVS